MCESGSAVRVRHSAPLCGLVGRSVVQLSGATYHKVFKLIIDQFHQIIDILFRNFNSQAFFIYKLFVILLMTRTPRTTKAACDSLQPRAASSKSALRISCRYEVILGVPLSYYAFYSQEDPRLELNSVKTDNLNIAD